MKRLNLPLLLILCICPFGFHSIGTCNQAKTLNTHRPSDDNAVCPLIDSGFRGELLSTDDLSLCPWKEGENEIGPDKRDTEGRSPSFSSLTALQRLIYEIVAGAATARHASSTLPNSATADDKRPPKHIKKLFPGLKRKRWKAMLLSFSENYLLGYIFYRSYQRHCSIADFIGMIGCALRDASVCYVANVIVLLRYSFALSIFWTRYTFICTRYHLRYFWRGKIKQCGSIVLQVQLFLILTRTFSLSFALKVFSESRHQRTGSRKSSNTLWSKILRLLVLLSHVLRETPPVACSAPGNLSLLNIAVTVVALAVKYVYRRCPTLEQAQAHLQEICPPIDDCCGTKDKHSSPPPAPRFRPKTSRGRSTVLLRMLIILSLPTLVTATNNAAAAAATSFQTATTAAVAGSGVAASCVYYAHRTRKWTQKENELKALCISCGVEYLPPPPHESEKEQATRREMMVEACQRMKKEQRRAKDEEALMNRCSEHGVVYKPPPPGESARQQENRRRNLNRACDDELRKNRADDMKKRRANETPQQKERDANRKREARQNQSPEDKARDAKRNQSPEDKARDAKRKREARQNQSPEDKARDAKRKREDREAKRKAENDAYHEEDIFINDEIPDIDVCLEGARKARELLLRTARRDASGNHQAIGCTVCDEFIIGTEELCCITKERLLMHRDRLGADRYQEEYLGGQAIDEELKKQYEIRGMEGLLLSRRFGKDDAEEFSVCSKCRDSLRKDSIDKAPPKYSIANGFLIGSIPTVIAYKNKDGVEEEMKTIIETLGADGKPIPNQTMSKVTSIMAAALSPTRPYAYIFSYRGGRHKSLVGNFQFFDTDQSKVANALKCLHQSGANANIYVVLNGPMTPSQKQIVRRKAELDTNLYFGLLRWFKQHHPAFRDVDIGDEGSALKVELIEDKESDANTDQTENPGEETKEEGATFYFSSAGEPTTDTSVYSTTKDLVLALLKDHSAPTLAIHGGNYSSHSDVMRLENVFPTIFPFGSGGPTLKRRSKISKQEVIRHYLRLSLPQFMESEFILVANYLLGRILSYESAKIKCRPRLDANGTAVGDEIGRMSVEEIREATKEEQRNGSLSGVRGRAKMFLKAVRATCRQLGMSEEAAKSARRQCFALQDFFGMHSLFVTITIDDECSFRVRLYPYVDANGGGTPLPPIDSSDAECLADLTLRKRVRKQYPGACSLEFQSSMQIALETLFGWNPGRRKGKRGLFGIVEAFCRADEEQGRGSLHAHWLVWIKNFGHLRRLLFASDENTKKRARASYIAYINKVMCARQCAFEVEATHTCEKGKVVRGKVNDIFENCDATVLREARHHAGCTKIKGEVMKCKKCGKIVSPFDVTTAVLKNLQEQSTAPLDYPLSSERLDIAAYRTTYDVPDVSGSDSDSISRYILSNERFNQHAWKHVNSCFKKGCECRHQFPYLANPWICEPEASCPDPTTRQCLEREVEDPDSAEEAAGVANSAMASEPMATDSSGSGTRIYEGETPIEVVRHTLDGNTSRENRFVVDVERPQGCQYMNVHNRVLSYIFACNTNNSAGDSGQTRYQTVYNTKNTQSDDREARDMVAKNVIRRLIRAQKEKEVHKHGCDRSEEEARGEEEEINTWVEGLSRVLSGINAATSRNVISAPMSHNLASNNGSRFHFSHEFVELLVGQLQDVLEGNVDNVDCMLRTCREGKETKTWKDISSLDYVYRPKELEAICFYQQFMHFTKRYKQDGLSTNNENEGGEKLTFVGNHPGLTFAYLSKLTLAKIPNMSIPEGSLCRIEELDINNNSPSPELIEKRENYAKIALLMFCPLRYQGGGDKTDDKRLDKRGKEGGGKELNDKEANEEDTKEEGVNDNRVESKGYWQIFDTFRSHYFDAETKLSYKEKCKRNETFLDLELPDSIQSHYLSLAPDNFDPSVVGDEQHITAGKVLFVTSFWMKGFEILQNIDDRLNVEKCRGRATDVLSDLASLPPEYEDIAKDTSDDRDDDLVKDIAFYCEQFESEQWDESENGIQRDFSHDRILEEEKTTITDARVVEARLKSDESLISDSSDTAASGNDGSTPTNTSGNNSDGNRHLRDMESYTTILRLIQGSLLGGKYEDVYDDDEMDIEDAPDFPQEQDDAVHGSQEIRTPTLAGVARAVLREDKTRLDEKQYIMYEVISCSFLLGLLDLRDHRGDESPLLLQLLRGAIGVGREDFEHDVENLKRKLRDRGAREQLLMFVTGFAGAGKSTAIKVAQRFCYEFCQAASIMWADNTFLFTAYTGSAAAEFGGLTTVSATYLSRKGNPPKLTDEEMDELGNVRMLIIDEISFLKESELLKLDNILKKVGEQNKAFGGFNIIFSGDFQQIEPVRIKDAQKLWHPASRRHFENNINCAIILDGIHRFKDDEDYGRILQRLCRGEMTQEDVDKLNERYVGVGGVDLPKKPKGDTCYACALNKQRNAVMAARFRDHLRRTHPQVGEDKDPPKHTIIIKGFIESKKSSHIRIGGVLRKRIIELGDSDMTHGTKLISPHLCCYNGAYFMCNSNDNLKDHGTGNGTQARLVGVKLKDNPKSYKCEVWDKRKVWTVCASDVEFAEFEHCSGESDSPRRFRLAPKKVPVEVNVTPHDMATEKVTMGCSVTQLPVNASDAITGHKLQGLTKDKVIVYSWQRSTNWIYVVLSRVRTLSGLYLFQKLRLSDIKPPSRDYMAFLGRMRDLEQNDLDRVERHNT